MALEIYGEDHVSLCCPLYRKFSRWANQSWLVFLESFIYKCASLWGFLFSCLFNNVKFSIQSSSSLVLFSSLLQLIEVSGVGL